MNKIFNALSISTSALFAIPILAYLNTGTIYHIQVFTGLIFTVLSSEFLKRHIIGTLSPRPHGATDCNLFCNDGDQSGQPGMPSTHTASTLYMITAYYGRTPILVQKILMVYGAFIAMSRYFKQCHTLLQIVFGALYGVLIALGVRYMGA